VDKEWGGGPYLTFNGHRRDERRFLKKMTEGYQREFEQEGWNK